MSYDVPPLRFANDALSPVITAADLVLHHDAIHPAYTAAINHFIAAYPDLGGKTIEALLANLDAVPSAIRDVVTDIAGGHANHQFFWKVIGPDGGTGPSGPLAAAVDRDFGGLNGLKHAFKEAALALDGPGWAFLSLVSPRSPELEVLALPDNGSVLPIGKPGVMICDLWDHAWNPAHASLDAWVDAYWSIVDWKVCDLRYDLLVDGKMPP